jgi:hypothetical protein
MHRLPNRLDKIQTCLAGCILFYYLRESCFLHTPSSILLALLLHYILHKVSCLDWLHHHHVSLLLFCMRIQSERRSFLCLISTLAEMPLDTPSHNVIESFPPALYSSINNIYKTNRSLILHNPSLDRNRNRREREVTRKISRKNETYVWLVGI